MNNRILRFILFSLAGKIISETLGKKTAKKNELQLPSFHGIIEVKHSLKGRIRLRVPILKESEQGREILLSQLSKISTIKKIEINNITGSLTLEYDDSQMNPQLLIGVIIKLLNLEYQINNRPKALLNKEMSTAKEAVNLAIYNKSKGILDLKSLLAFGFIIIGIRKVKKSPLDLPNGYNLLRWGYKAI